MSVDWIPLKIELPKRGKRVLFARANNIVCEGYVTVGNVFARGGDGRELKFEPTHWADLPEPPKDTVNRDE